MNEARSRWAPLAIFVVASSLSKLALGQAAPCAGPEIELAVPDRERPQWQALLEKLREHARTLPDLDRCARLTVRAEGDTLLLDVRTGDGRTASRPVANEAQLLRASEALLTLPPNASDLPLAVPSASELPPEPRAPAPAPAPRADASVELGAGAAARLGGSPLYVAGGVAGFGDVAVAPWLLGVSARWEITTGLLGEPTLMDYYLMSTAVGVHVGRRFELESSSLDLLLGPNFVLDTQDADDGLLDIGGSAVDVRIDLGARLSGARRATWRAFGSADLELSPARLAREHFAHPSLPPLPSFTFGLTLGLLWSSK